MLPIQTMTRPPARVQGTGGTAQERSQMSRSRTPAVLYDHLLVFFSVNQKMKIKCKTDVQTF